MLVLLPVADGMIAQTIQLALAPVFVLVALGNILSTLANRLGRVVDRSRELQQRHGATQGMEHDLVVREIRTLDRRITLIGSAMRLLVLAGLAIGVTVMLLFVQEFLGLQLNLPVAGTFIVAIGLLMWALVLFLRETQEATKALRIPEEYLEKEREL
ncbi:DUF2721 domain-containing protein [Erythrobacter sp. EC-HK427]|uniref:DUF2721 domain-containing protein n=1 Tax=Erythrobacter sp. EC-HK427 TaxID=2038396 RepID=UPI00125362FD|nr:DUF2721 domain-containing protein [Erythrobacter sp. EC-HK427]VVT06426.1 conserved membrane hypothetical protein [Erythrobacter sp. EC-HK427]